MGMKCGWKNGDDKMRMVKYGCLNVNDNIGTRENKLTTFSCILSRIIRPRGIHRSKHFLTPVMKKVNSDSVSLTTSKDFGHLLLSKFPLPQTSIF